MNSINAIIRSTNTKGQVNSLRKDGNVPAIVYGGKEENEKVSIPKKIINFLVSKENFLSNILELKIEGKSQKVLPREIKFDNLTDEPIHIDFLRVIKGSSVVIEVPVKFINNEKSPGLKRGGVLNIVRRKVELKCPSENIPSELIVDLDGVDIGHSFKISSIELPQNVVPTIQGRDFVIATVAAPTVIKEPEKPAETNEGEEGAETASGSDTTDEAAKTDAKSGANDGEKKEGDKKDSDKKDEPKKT